MKKIIALAFSLILGLSLTACGNDKNMGSDMRNGMSSLSSAAESIVGDVTGNSNTASKAKITEAEAKAAALKHAGIDEANITGFDIDLDRDDGVLKYEIDFYSNGVEYDYDINAQTGEIISSSKDTD